MARIDSDSNYPPAAIAHGQEMLAEMADGGTGKVTSTSILNAIDAKVSTTTMNAALADKADLVGGVVPSSQMPSIAVMDRVPVADEAARLALTSAEVQPGDVAVQADTATTWLLIAPDPSDAASWKPIDQSDAVESVNGQTGTVVLGKGDIGLGNVDNTADADKPISTATAGALATKQPLDADLTTLATLGVVSDPSTGRLAIGGVEVGGTGPIDVSASLLNGWALGSGGSLVLSRSKNVVMLEGSNLVRAAATSNQFLTVLSGFRPASATASFTVWDTYQISGTIVERGHVLAVGTARLDSAGSSAATKYFTASWVTNDAWPASI